MSSPRRKSQGPNEIREGTRFVLKEITASLHNSSVKQSSPRKSGNDPAPQKSPEHAVKVQFAREFADVQKTTPSVTESLSSASSFQSLSSTLSSKSSSGICADSPSPGRLPRSANTSYINSDIPGLDDLIAACADIKISEQDEQTDIGVGTGDLSQDQTFSSAVGDLSIREEDEEQEIPKEEAKLNGTFEVDCPASDPPEKSLPPLEQISAQDLSSIVPFVSFEDSVLKTHSLHAINKDSLVFSTAVEFQQLEGFVPKFIDEDKSNVEINDTKNESIEQSNSTCFNASIDSLKNISACLVDANKNISTLEITQSPSLPLLPYISNNSTALGENESVENKTAASPKTEPVSILSVTQIISKESVKTTEEIPHNFEESVKTAEEIPDNSEESVKTAEEIPDNSEESVKTAEEIPDNSEESVKAAEEIPDISEDSALNSTFPVIPNEDEHQVSTGIVESAVDESILKDSSQRSDKSPLKSTIPQFLEKIAVIPNYDQPQVSNEIINSAGDESLVKNPSPNSEPEKNKCPLILPIPQSILDKVAEQQKALDDIFTLDELNTSEAEKSPVCYNEEEGPKKFNLSPIIELSSDSGSSPEQKVLDSTIVISPKKSEEAQEIVANSKELLISPEKVPETNNDSADSSSEIVFLKQKTLESTIIRVDGNHKKHIPEIKISSPNKNLEDRTLENCNTLINSVNFPEKKEVQETSPVKVVKDEFQFELAQTETPKRPTEKSKINEAAKKIEEDIKKIETAKIGFKIETANDPVELDSTIILEDSEIDLEASDIVSIRTNLTQEEDYETFKPQQQSTDLMLTDPSIFDRVEFEAQAVANEIYNKSLELVDDNDQFLSANSELFQDPAGFDFLLSQGSSNNRSRDLRFESLYVKFDPLVNKSMLPQGNSQTEDEEKNEKNEIPSVPSVDTPIRNPAIAAIDRLLFYSPITPGNKTEATKDMKEASESSPQEIPVVDEKMAKELELVRSLVVQLEEKLEKVEKERGDDMKKYQKDLKKLQDENRKLEEKNSRLEAQLTQEIESKKQVTVVLDEYERSISRLVAERERDRADLEEKTRMKEELQAANQHLSNTEAAFNDVHQKYERVKSVVAAYKSNEAVLKESVQENVETIKALENRYEQLKSHAMAQLEKANHELETIRKQNESEAVKLQAMLKKAELKSKSLTDLVEQKSIENKELAKILDEVIARVGNKNSD